MKQYFLAAFAAFIITGCSSTHQMNPYPGEQGAVSSVEAQFEMERKIKEAHREGVKEGIAIGFSRAKKIIADEYYPYIKRLEVGKYAMRKGYITPPEVMVFQTKSGTLDYRATGCRIEKELDVNEIFKKFGSSVVADVNEKLGEDIDLGEKGDSESYSIVSRDEIQGSISKTTSAHTSVLRAVTASEANRILLEQYNIRFIEKEGEFKVSFESVDEMKGFCSQFQICGGS